MQLRLPPQQRRSQAFQEYLANIRAIPGVDAAAVATAIPLRPLRGGFFRMVGEPPEMLAWGEVTTGPFETRVFSGGHFYPQGARPDVLAAVRAAVAPAS